MRLSHTIVVIGVLSAGCNDPLNPKTWIRRLNDPREQKEAVRQLVKLKDKQAVPPLIELFKKSKDPEHLRAVASFDDPAAVPAFMEALDYNEETYDSASIAATALGELKAQEAVDILVKAASKPLPIKSRANVVRVEAIKAIGNIGDRRAVEGLIKILNANPEDQDFFIHKQAAEALGKLRDPRAVPVLVRGLFMNGAGPRQGANIFQECRAALIAIGDPSVDKLIETMQRKNQEVEDDAKKRDFFAGIVVDKSSSILGDLRAKRAVPALLEQLAKKDTGLGKGVSETQAALAALGKIADPAAVKPIMTMMTNPKSDYRHRSSAADALNFIGDTSALPALLQVSKTTWLRGTTIDPEAARVAASAMVNYARLTDADNAAKLTFPKLDAELQESDMGNAVKSAQERLEVVKECKQDVACYGKYLDEGTGNKGEKAAFMLSRMGKPALKVLAKHIGHRDPQARLAVLFAVGRVADSGDAEVRETLAKQIELDKTKPPLRYMVADMKALEALLLPAAK